MGKEFLGIGYDLSMMLKNTGQKPHLNSQCHTRQEMRNTSQVASKQNLLEALQHGTGDGEET